MVEVCTDEGKNALQEFRSFLRMAQLCSNTLAYPQTHERKWVIRKGQPWPEKVLIEGLYPYVVLPDGEIRLAALPRPSGITFIPQGMIYHPELVGGKDVIAAGMVKVQEMNGRRVVTYLSNESGHYRPREDSVDYALCAFRFWKVPLAENIELDAKWIFTSNIQQ